MERIEPTRRIVLKVWWALAWRFVLCCLVISLLQGLLIGGLTGMFELSPEAVERLTSAATLLFGLPLTLLASWAVLFGIFDKRLGDFEIALLKRD
ncbi:MAG: hypothetical protein ABIJ96_02865 [Elusimicrobiota bacterium]